MDGFSFLRATGSKVSAEQASEKCRRSDENGGLNDCQGQGDNQRTRVVLKLLGSPKGYLRSLVIKLKGDEPARLCFCLVMFHYPGVDIM